MNQQLRRALHERALGCCEYCGTSGATNAHHRKNRSQGGQDTLSNLLLLCGSGTTGCHGWVTNCPIYAHAQGLTVLSTENPAKVPVFRWSRFIDSREVVLLDDRGGLTLCE